MFTTVWVAILFVLHWADASIELWTTRHAIKPGFGKGGGGGGVYLKSFCAKGTEQEPTRKLQGLCSCVKKAIQTWKR